MEYEGNIDLCTYKKSEYGMCPEAGTPAFRQRFFFRIKEWELESMKALVKQLELHMEEVYKLRFFYSFQIPKLGKEFDLLQIKDDQIVNIELKSGIVSDEAIRRQLIQNRYYLSVFGKPILSYTYISSEDHLVRLTNHDHIVEGTGNSYVLHWGKKARTMREISRICFRQSFI